MSSTDINSLSSHARRPWAARDLNAEVLERARAEGYTPLQARILAGRYTHAPEGALSDTVSPSVRDIPRASELPDMAIAAERVVRAIANHEVIATVTDHDADGLAALTVLWSAFTKVFGVPASRIHAVASHRLTEGYGVSQKLVERVLALSPRPTLVITADQGSADEPRIRELAEHGIDTIVTDHHHIPVEGPPASAIACVNPARADSGFDPTIAGCMVAWYLAVAVQQGLKAAGIATVGSLMDLTSFVALGTCADCVDLGTSKANRWVVRAGLDVIRSGKQPVWGAFSQFVRGDWNSTAISWQVASRINAASRMGDASRGLEAMCAPDVEQAHAWVSVLDEVNTARKAVQADLTERALGMAAFMLKTGASAMIIPFYEQGHAGVHGVVAGRVVEATGLPTVCLSPVDGDPLAMTGSIRSVEGAHVKHILDKIAAERPELNLRGGGHAFAGGVRLLRDDVPKFAVDFELAVAEALADRVVPPREHDGSMVGPISAETVGEIEALAPYGRGFPEPVFVADVEIMRVAALGKDGKHCKLDVIFPGNQMIQVPWFSSVGTDGRLPEVRGKRRLVYEVRRSTYARGPGYDVLLKDIQ